MEDKKEENQKSWTVNFFQTARGNYPVKEFIQSQDAATIAKILHSIKLLSNNGPFLKPPYIKKLQNNVYELRIPGRVNIRIFYTLYIGNYFLLHAFKKKSQKTPLKEIKIAVDRINEII